MPIKIIWAKLRKQERVKRQKMWIQKKDWERWQDRGTHRRESCWRNKAGHSSCSMMGLNQVMINVLQLPLSFQWSLYSSVQAPEVHRNTQTHANHSRYGGLSCESCTHWKAAYTDVMVHTVSNRRLLTCIHTHSCVYISLWGHLIEITLSIVAYP